MAAPLPVSAAALPLYGSTPCRASYSTGKACRNNAYYYTKGRNFLCGQHSKADARTKLPKPSASEKRMAAEAAQEVRGERIKERTQVNAAYGRRGQVALYRMSMMKAVAHQDGYLSVFPNNKHAGRQDGLGLATLSPMQLGPVVHSQPGLPDALNLENFWQQSKQLVGESDEAFLAAQKAGFLDPIAKRHKQKGATVLGWIWVDPETRERHVLDRIQARQFYCNYYERLALKANEWATLEGLVAKGTPVQISGYDGYMMDDVEAAYMDKDLTFGHEAMLYTMLKFPDPATWPWRKHKTFAF